MWRAGRGGFTLVELLVGIAVLVLTFAAFSRLQMGPAALASQERQAPRVLASAVRHGAEFAASRQVTVYLYLGPGGKLALDLQDPCPSCTPLESLGAIPTTCTVSPVLSSGSYSRLLEFRPPGVVVNPAPPVTLTVLCSRSTGQVRVDRWGNATPTVGR